MLRKARCFIFLLLIPLSAWAQPDLSGSWKGHLTQGEGGYAPQYEFELYLQQNGRSLAGRSYVSVGRIFAVWELKGEFVNDKQIRIYETRLVDHWKYEGMEWCHKQAQLTLFTEGRQMRLEGPWTGNTGTSDCIPGKISLKKEAPRA